MRRLVSHCRSALRAVALVAFALAAPLAIAQDHGAFVNGPALDALFEELRVAPDEATAQRIDQRIWLIWTSPDDPELAGRMQRVFAAQRSGDPIEAIVLLNRIVEDFPDYAEGWNQRASMFYTLRNFQASLDDCEKVLELEPRHFGALSGRAIMYLQQGRRALALRDMAAALDIHPFLAGRQYFPELQRTITRI